MAIAKAVKQPKTKTNERAGLLFPVQRFGNMLRRGNFASQVSVKAAVCMSSVLEFLVRELLEVTVKITIDQKLKIITPQMIQMALQADEDFQKIASEFHILAGG